MVKALSCIKSIGNIKEVKRKTPMINLNKISSNEDHNIVIKEINATIKRLKEKGKEDELDQK